MHLRLSLLLCFATLCFSGYAQQERIYVRSDRDLVYFYPNTPIPQDSCLKTGLSFYLFALPASRPGFKMLIENARFTATENDSVFRFEYLPGMQYEILYQAAADEKADSPERNYRNWRLTTLLNGSSALPKEEVRIRIYKERGEFLLYDKRFCIRF